ncbi:MAG: signal peptidase I, partial [Bacillota bacterium]
LDSFFNELRSKSKGTYIMALLNPDYYDQLYEAIEVGGIDDYMVKPIRKEDFLARIQIATRKSEYDYQGYQSKPYFPEDESEVPESKDSEEFDEELTDQKHDYFSSEDELEKEEKDEFAFEKFELTEQEGEEPTPEEDSTKDFTPTEGPDLFGDEEDLDESKHEVEQSEEEPETGHEFSLDSDLDFETEPEPELDQDLNSSSSVDFEPDRAGGFEFDDIIPSEDEQKEEFTETDDESISDLEDENYGLFDDSSGRETDQDMESGDDVLGLFDDETSDQSETQKDDQGFKSIEDLPGGSEPSQLDEDKEHNGFETAETRTDEPGPDVLRPADDFFRDADEDAGSDTGKKGSSSDFILLSPEEEDKRGFDQLFDDIPSRTEESSDESEESTFPEVEETLPSESPLKGEEQENESRRGTLRSQLPGKSADDFLFGKDSDQEQEQSQDDNQGYNQGMLNQFTEEEDTTEEETGKRARARERNGSRKRFPRIFAIFGNIIFVILLLIMAVLSFFLIQSRIAGGVPQVAGYQIYIVLSGSMQPEFDTGSLAFVRETDPEALTAGDIITFRSPANPDSLTTHRIVEVQDDDELQFVTRGDANNVNDPNPVPAENVVGKVTGSVPYAGYLMNFVQTSQGLILLIFVPGVLIIVFELGKIMKYLTQGDKKKKNQKKGEKNHPVEVEK